MLVLRNVHYCQAKNYWLCIHIGSTAVFFGFKWADYAHRLEVCTPDTWFRFSRGVRKAKP